MKNCFLIIFAVISFFIAPAIGNASYIIHLKNGGQLKTSHYWLENQQVKFYIRGGVMAIEKDSVGYIEESPVAIEDGSEAKTKEGDPAEVPKELTKDPLSQLSSGELNLKNYQERMAKLKDDLNKTLVRIQSATTKEDQAAKDDAIEDNRKISAEMWSLTEELKQKNDGHLPADWWEGVGQPKSTQ